MPPKPKPPGKRKDGDSGVGAEVGDTGARPKEPTGLERTREEESSSDDDDPQERIARGLERAERQRTAAEADARELLREEEEARRRAEQVRLNEEARRAEEARGRAAPGAGAQGVAGGQGEAAQQAGDPALPPAPPPPPQGPAWNADEDDVIMAGARVNANQLAILGEFKGEGDDIELFVMQVIRCREAFDWNHQVTAQLVQTCLKGTAAKWLRSALKTQLDAQHLEVWDHMVPGAAAGAPAVRAPNTGFRYALLTRFRELQNGQAAVEAVGDLKQKSNESVDEFYDRILLAMDRKNYTSTEADKETDEYKTRLTLDAFIFLGAGLKDELRKVVSVQVPAAANIQQLLTRARAAELVRRKDKTPSYLHELEAGESADATGEAADQGAEGGAAAAVMPTLAEMMLEIEALKKNMFKGAADVECWNCHQMGHFSYECQTKRTIAPRGRGRGAAAGRGRRPPAGGARGPPAAAGARGRGRGRGRAPPGGRRRLYVVDADGFLEEEVGLDQLDVEADADGLDYNEASYPTPEYNYPNGE